VRCSSNPPTHRSVLPIPQPGPDQVLLRVHACAICRTDLPVLTGELTNAKCPLVLQDQAA
jgi:propanol-preferring alcohol dehydrogenase